MGPPCCRWCSNSRANFMNQRILAAFWLLAAPVLIGADSQWVLGQSTLSYHVSHPLHESVGVSHEARGKGVCHAGQCDFLDRKSTRLNSSHLVISYAVFCLK